MENTFYTMTSYLPVANTSEIRHRLYKGAIQLGNLTGFNTLIGTWQKPHRHRSKSLNFKIVVLGDSSTGKTSLIARYLENRDIELKPLPTQYGEYHTRRLVLGERRVGVQVWDVPCHVLSCEINDECFLQRSLGAIIVYDVSKRSSFENVENYLRKFRRYAFPGAMCLLLANKGDLQTIPPSNNNNNDQQSSSNADDNNHNNNNSSWVTAVEGRRFADGFSMEFIEASAYTGTNVQEAFNSLLQALNDAASDYYAKAEMS